MQLRLHVRSADTVDIGGSDGGTLALADIAGVGAVELPSVPRQGVVDQMVDTGWIEKSTYFPHPGRRRRWA